MTYGIMIAAAVRDGQFEAEGWRVRKDGSRFWASAVVDAIRDETGRLIGFPKVTRDISERRMARGALRDSERQFRLLIDGVKDYALFMLDPDGIVSSWNAGAQRIKGYKADEILGQHFSCFYTDSDSATGIPAQLLLTAERNGRAEHESLRVRRDGTLFWANTVSSGRIRSSTRCATRLAGCCAAPRRATRAEIAIADPALPPRLSPCRCAAVWKSSRSIGCKVAA
jgi:PAS domain S-box-containing protein